MKLHKEWLDFRQEIPKNHSFIIQKDECGCVYKFKVEIYFKEWDEWYFRTLEWEFIEQTLLQQCDKSLTKHKYGAQPINLRWLPYELYQPERSKREDSQKCEMRCSEHCRNTVRDK